MRLRYQRGCLRRTKRKSGPDCWEFLWRENDIAGNRVHRTAVVGTVEQYPTQNLVYAAVNGLRMYINQDRNRQREQRIAVADLVDHYIQTELAEETGWHSHATRIVYREFLKRWIRPYWAGVDIREVRTVTVERWLRSTSRADGAPLADTTRAKIRSLMSVLFNHAIRYEWLEQGKNPITLVRQSAKRKRTPEVLEPHEIQRLLRQLTSCFRLMVLLDATTGLRRSELLALKWSDIDFSSLELNIVRSIYLRTIGNCKTEASRRPVPLDAHVAADLWLWKETSVYSKPDDWVFASHHTHGQYPFWPDIVLQKIIRPAALRAGITKRIGWHTFRHSYSSLLVANGENVKVVQELMRHASSRVTLEIYSHARMAAKRHAQERVVQMILPEDPDDAVSTIRYWRTTSGNPVVELGMKGQ
jgi:integrase